MNQYVTGAMIKRIREQRKMTQSELARKMLVSDKTISKWETGKGYPDITLIEPLAAALGISVIELMSGDNVTNKNRASNMLKSRIYVCPICGNVIHAMGEGAVSCCGIRLPEQDAEDPDELHRIYVENLDGELYVYLDHPMEKGHSISFMAYVTDCHLQMEKLYPEQAAQAHFRRAGRGTIFAFCNRHGLFSVKV